MRPKHSEVFENYAKIASEKGLIDTSKVSIAEAMSQDEKYSNKDWKETISMLYGVKPNGKEDDESIVDKAHPHSIIIAPSYDKVNGLVENINERSDIMKGIALKTPSGNYGGWKQANDELLMNLVRLGNSMDNKNITSLMTLSDSCAQRIEKRAFWGVLVKALPYIGHALGWGSAVVAVKEHFVGKLNQGITNNAESTIESLLEIKDEADSKSKFIIQSYIEAIIYVKELSLKANSLHPPATLSGSDPVAKLQSLQNIADENTKENLDFINLYISSLTKLNNALPALEQTINTMGLNQEKHSEYIEMGRQALNLLFGDDISDAKNNISTLKESLQEQLNKINHSAVEAKTEGDLVGKNALEMLSKKTKANPEPESSEQDGESYQQLLNSQLANRLQALQ